jgi:hypothetical protein
LSPSAVFNLADQNEATSEKMESNEQEDNQLDQLVDISDDVHILDKQRFYSLDVYFNLIHHSWSLKETEEL